MINDPKIFIIILNYNSYDDTIECIKSLKDIDYSNYNIVIVDNLSTDDSYLKLKNKLKGYNIIEADSNLGYASGNNIGIRYALNNGAEYVCILNSDVVVEKDFLKKLVGKMSENSKIGIAGSCICDYYKRDIIQGMGARINLYFAAARRNFKGENYNEIEKKDVFVDYVEGACFLIKREVFEKIGLIPENYFLFFEETEFCTRTLKAGYKIVSVYSSRVYHKGSATINKFGGLSYAYLNRNRVIFVRRNSKWYQKIIFSVYIFIEAFGRMIIRKEPLSLFKYIFYGFMANKNSIDMLDIQRYLK
ncbi:MULTISPECIES: glycosyltransferase family 2 protein [Clostridium]|uniref:glycosyltransferase family 2 protein n=1 Tax=Clostridium TaxID=1485 RepID=UPI000826067B|nr:MULTISPECIES: glycosyltransferase family 2 protein [Clostridium]PJI09729.1 glycosyltransferase family 2 protein [Clostridium sp. CT7]